MTDWIGADSEKLTAAYAAQEASPVAVAEALFEHMAAQDEELGAVRVLSREAAAAKVACGAVTERGMVAVALPAPRVGWRWSWSVDKAGVAVPPVSTRGALAKLLTGCAPAPTLVASPAQDIPLRDLD